MTEAERSGGSDRDLEVDLEVLADRLRDDEFAREMYCALCNADWAHRDGTRWHGTWRHAAGLVARVRDRDEIYLDFYCSGHGAEGTISSRVATSMAELGWTGTGHGSDHVYVYDFSGGTQTQSGNGY